jgi:hypothetical protein
MVPEVEVWAVSMTEFWERHTVPAELITTG